MVDVGRFLKNHFLFLKYRSNHCNNSMISLSKAVNDMAGKLEITYGL